MQHYQLHTFYYTSFLLLEAFIHSVCVRVFVLLVFAQHSVVATTILQGC